MTVIERTGGGYTKIRDKNGVVSHRDPNGHPVKQQSFAASKAHDTWEWEVTERDEETGHIIDSEAKKKDRKRVTIAFKKLYEPKHITRKGQDDPIGVELEASGVMPDDEIDDAIDEMVRSINDEIHWFGGDEVDVEDSDISTQDTDQDESSLEGTVGFDQYSVNKYRIKGGEVDFDDKA